jgi:hypothetical protein
MPALPNYYRLTHVETGEVLEGYANDLATKLKIAPSTIQKAFYDERVMSNGYRIEKIEREKVNKKGINSDIWERWDRYMEGIRKKYGKKRA